MLKVLVKIFIVEIQCKSGRAMRFNFFTRIFVLDYADNSLCACILNQTSLQADKLQKFYIKASLNVLYK